MKLFLDLTRNPNIHSLACGNTIEQATADALVDRYRHHFSAEYELYRDQWRARLNVKLFRNQILKGEQLEQYAELFMEDAIGMHPAHSAFALGGVRVGKEMYKLVTESGKRFTPRVFMVKTNQIKANLDISQLGHPVRHLTIGQRDYHHAIELKGETSGNINGGYFAQMINPYGDKSPDGALVGLVIGYRPRYRLDHANKVARMTDKRDLNRCHLTILYGRDFDTLMKLVELGGEAVKPMFIGEGAYFGTRAPEVVETEEAISAAEERALVRTMLIKPKPPLKQPLGDKLKDIVIEPSASAAAPMDDSTSTDESSEEHISDSDSDSLATSDGDEASEDAGSESDSSSTSSDEAPASESEPGTTFRTAAQQRMFDADAEKKRVASQAANDTAASV